jgi:site-specific DNA recombinase
VSYTRSAIIIARETKDKQGNREAVHRQVQDAIDWIGQQLDVRLNTNVVRCPLDPKRPELGYWPAGAFVDNDTGNRKGSKKKRPWYDKAIGYIHSGEADMIVSLHQFRVWRNQEQMYAELAKLHDLDVRFRFLKNGSELNPSKPADKAMIGMMGVWGEYETDLAEERQEDSTRHAAKAGAYHGARPFGYQLHHLNLDGNGTHPAPPTQPDGRSGICEQCGPGRQPSRFRTLVPDPAEAEAVRQSYEMVDAGFTPYQVCQYLDGQEIYAEDGVVLSRAPIPTAGGKTWESVGVQSLLKILRSRRNIGKREWSQGWEGGKRPAPEVSDALWPAIVDEELFWRVQDILKHRHKARPGGSEPAHLLTGFAYCGTCGARLRIHRIKGKRRYACSAWQGKGCVSRDAASVEAEVQRVLYQWLAHNGQLTKTLEVTGNADLQKLYATRRTLRTQRDTIADKHSDGIYDDATYLRLRDRKEEQLAEVNGKIDAMFASGATGTRGRSDFPTGSEFRAKWRNPETTLEEKRAILARFVDKVVVHPIGAGNQPDPLLIQVFPGAWAADVDKAQPGPVPGLDAITSRGKILAMLREDPGRWFTREDIADGTGVSPTATHKTLTALGAAGEVSREWRQRGGQRACYVYSAASGESWGPRTRNGPDGTAGAREKVLAYLADKERAGEWLSIAEITSGSGAGQEPHVSRVVSQLLAAGFVQRRRAPLPRKRTRYQYSINGR